MTTFENENTVLRKLKVAGNHLTEIGHLNKVKLSAQIAADTEEFFANGGEVEQLPSFCYELEAHANKVQQKKERKRSMAELDRELKALMDNVNAGLR